MSKNIAIYARIKKSEEKGANSQCIITTNGNLLTVTDNFAHSKASSKTRSNKRSNYSVAFTKVLDESASQHDVFREVMNEEREEEDSLIVSFIKKGKSHFIYNAGPTNAGKVIINFAFLTFRKTWVKAQGPLSEI